MHVCNRATLFVGYARTNGCSVSSNWVSPLLLGRRQTCLDCKWYNHYWDLLVLVVCAQTYYVCMLWFKMSLSPVFPVHSVRVDSNVESCIAFKTSGRRPPLVSVCMFSECTVQLLLGVACEVCGSRPHCLVLALNRATYSTLPSRTPP